MAKIIDTLVADIKHLFAEGHTVDEYLVRSFGADVAQTVSDRLTEHKQVRGQSILRMSNLGKPDRQLWYDTHRDGSAGDVLGPDAKIKFMFGDILEHFLLFLAAEAGHTVTRRQAAVELDGVPGSIDCIIDGVLIDAKSASSYSFRKFQDGTLRMDDPFGYIEQLAGYNGAVGCDRAGFLVIDKTLGHICLDLYTKKELEAIGIRDRIAVAKEVVGSSVPPRRCYDPQPEGKSGNEVLGVGCSYCRHKKECWSDANGGIGLRTFLYSTGPKYFTKVIKEPAGPKELSF